MKSAASPKLWLAAILAIALMAGTLTLPSLLESQPLSDNQRIALDVVKGSDGKYTAVSTVALQKIHLDRSDCGVASGDAVFRGQTKIGWITSISRSVSENSLTIIFAPEPSERVAVGDIVWIAWLGSSDQRGR